MQIFYKLLIIIILALQTAAGHAMQWPDQQAQKKASDTISQQQKNCRELQNAIVKCDVVSLAVLIKIKKIDVNTVFEDGNTPLSIAVVLGSKEIVNRLLQYGANSNQSNSKGYTPLIFAVINNNKEIVKLLLEKEANVNYINNDAQSPLLIASCKGSDEIVALLIQAKANVKHVNNDGKTALHCAAACGHKKIMRLLLENGADSDYSGDDITPLSIAAITGQYSSVKFLLKHRAKIPKNIIEQVQLKAVMAEEQKNLEQQRSFEKIASYLKQTRNDCVRLLKR